MSVKINVKKKYIVNGKEYSSVDEMPQEIREAYEKALVRGKEINPNGAARINAGKIVFNGVEYGNEEEMPQNERQMYTTILESIGREDSKSNSGLNLKINIAEKKPPGLVRMDEKPISPGSFFSVQKIFILIGFLILLVLLYNIYGNR